MYRPSLGHSEALQRRRARSLSVSEVMTILIHFHQSHYRNFKAYCCEHVFPHMRSEFPGLVSYARFVDFIPSALLPLCAYFQRTLLGECTGISFIDSTSLEVCLNQRIASHKVFAGLTEHGKTSTGSFFWFQTTPGHQRARGIAQHIPDAWQCG